MKGWTADGTEIELTTDQARIVSSLLDWHEDGRCCILPAVGWGWGKTVVMATVARYIIEGGGRDPQPTGIFALREIFRPHSCGRDYLTQPDRPGIIVQCDCGQLWRSIYPGNPAYAGWRRVGPVYRWLHRKRFEP